MDRLKGFTVAPPYLKKTLSGTIVAAALFLLPMPQKLAAAEPETGYPVTFTASGTFTATPLSGADTLKLSGQPFTITLVGNSAAVPGKHGQNWAAFPSLTMNGTVYSALLPNEPIAVGPATATLQQFIGAKEDILKSSFPVVVVGIALNIDAYLTVPGGTLTTALIHPFPSTAINSDATVTYSDTSAATVLGIQSGTLVATVSTTPAKRGKIVLGALKSGAPALSYR